MKEKNYTLTKEQEELNDKIGKILKELHAVTKGTDYNVFCHVGLVLDNGVLSSSLINGKGHDILQILLRNGSETSQEIIREIAGLGVKEFLESTGSMIESMIAPDNTIN